MVASNTPPKFRAALKPAVVVSRMKCELRSRTAKVLPTCQPSPLCSLVHCRPSLTLNPALPSSWQALNITRYFIRQSTHTPLPFQPASSGLSFRTLLQHHFFSHILPERILVRPIFCTPARLRPYLLDHSPHDSGILVSTSIGPAKQWASQTQCWFLINLHNPST